MVNEKEDIIITKHPFNSVKEKITVLGNPLSDNHLYGSYPIGKRVIRFMSKAGKDYKKLCIISAGNFVQCTDKPVIMTISVFFGDRRKRDVHGHLKALIDGFNGILYKDDSQIVGLVVTKHYDPKLPRSVITVEETVWVDGFD